MKSTIAIIDPAVKKPELDALNHLSLLSPNPITYHLPALFGMASLQRISAQNSASPLAGVIIFGSLASVHDNDSWQIALADWLGPVMLGGTPTLGICFGHQFIAKLLGGEVGFARTDRKKIQCCREVFMSANPLWGNSPTQGFLCASHEETVSSVPKCMQIIGHSETIPTDVLAHRTLPIWTFQTHPEAVFGFLETRAIPGPASGDPYSFGTHLMKRFLEFVAKVR